MVKVTQIFSGCCSNRPNEGVSGLLWFTFSLPYSAISRSHALRGNVYHWALCALTRLPSPGTPGSFNAGSRLRHSSVSYDG